MPKPIPDWDLVRRLVRFISTRQISDELVTVRETTTTTGIGRDRIESLFEEKKVRFKIISDVEPSGKDLILIEYIPRNLAMDIGVSNMELDRTYRKVLDRYQQGEIRITSHRTRLTRKQREEMRVKEFWSSSLVNQEEEAK